MPRKHNKTTPLSRTVEYRTWRKIKARCQNPKANTWKHYGGRGITVCDRWNTSFANFLADMGKRPGPKFSIDRINNDGNYEPSNCRWATNAEQARNRRSTKNITWRGRTMCILDWANALSIPRTTLQDRFLKLGYTVERAFTKPCVHKRPHVTALNVAA